MRAGSVTKPFAFLHVVNSVSDGDSSMEFCALP